MGIGLSVGQLYSPASVSYDLLPGVHVASRRTFWLDGWSINQSRHQCVLPHPVIDLLCLAVSELPLRPVDVDAIHDPLLVMQVRRDGQENGGLGSGDLLYELQRITLT